MTESIDIKKVNSIIEQILMVYSQGEIRSDDIPHKINISISDVIGKGDNTVMIINWVDYDKLNRQDVLTEDSFNQCVIKDNCISLLTHPFKHTINLYLYDLRPHRVIYD